MDRQGFMVKWWHVGVLIAAGVALWLVKQNTGKTSRAPVVSVVIAERKKKEASNANITPTDPSGDGEKQALPENGGNATNIKVPGENDPENQATDVASNNMTAQWVIEETYAYSRHLFIRCPHCGAESKYPYTTCRACGKEYRISEYTCSRCDSRGKVICRYCLGKRGHVCSHCVKGRPNWGGPKSGACQFCDGAGWSVCGLCEASGRLPCNICGGKHHFAAVD